MPRIYTKDQLQSWYKAGDINARQYNAGLRSLADDSLQQMIQEKGFVFGTLGQIVKDWNDRHAEAEQSRTDAKILSGIEQEFKKTGKVPEALFATPESPGLMIWRSVKTGVQMVNEVGRASGKALGMAAGAWGAGPTLQKLIEFAGETAVNTAITGKGVTDIQRTAALGVKKVTEGVQSGAKALLGKSVETAATKAPAAAAGAEGTINPLVAEAKAAWESALGSSTAKTGQEAIAKLPASTAAKAAGTAGTAATHEATLARAQEFATPNLQDIGKIPPNAMLTAERGVKVREAFREPMQRLWNLLPEVARGNPQAELAFDAEVMNMAPALGSHKATATVAGRAGDIQKISPNHGLLNEVYDIMAGFAPEATAGGNWTGARQKMAQKLLELGSPEWVDDFFVQTDKALAGEVAGKTRGDLLRQAYVTTLLAQPRTWIKKGLGDVTGAFDKTMQTSFAGWLSKDAEKGVLMSDGPLAAKTMLQAMRHVGGASQPEFKGAIDIKDIVGYAKQNLGDKAAAEIASNAPSSFLNLHGEPEKWAVPSRVFEGMTDYTQRVGSLFGQYMTAAREATRMGLGKAEWNDFVAGRMAAPTKEMLTAGTEIAGNMTYTEPLGGIGKFIQRNLQSGPGFALFPFMHIPMNLTNRSISNIPGMALLSRGLMKDIEAGGLAGDMAMGRLGWGYMTSQYFWLMAKAGMITGSGPLDPKQRDVWLLDHRPYSMKVGDTWIPYGWAEPVSKQMSLLADMAYYSDYVDRDSLTSALAGVAVAATKDILGGSSYWETFSRIAKVTEKTGRSALEMIGEAAKEGLSTPVAALTGGPTAATVARGLDPHYKAIDNFMDDVKSRIPILRGDVPNRINPLTGAPEEYPVPWGAGWLSRSAAGVLTPFESSPVTKDPIAQEMENVGAVFPSFRKSQGAQPAIPGADPDPGQAVPVNLNDSEMSQLMEIYGKRKFDGNKTVRDVLQEMIADPLYKQMPMADKKDNIESTLRSNLPPAFDEFMAKNLEDVKKAGGNVEDSVAYRYKTSDLKKMMDKAPAADHQQMQADYLGAVNQQMQSTQEFEKAQQDYLDHNQPPFPVAPSEP